MSQPSASLVAVLVAVTDQARAALGGRSEVVLTAFPFKVGREERMNALQKVQAAIERRIGGLPPVNDLFLIEPLSDALEISRLHFAIAFVDGQYQVEDRGSRLGTHIAGQRLGGHGNPKKAPLRSGDRMVVGSVRSPYVFRFELRSSDAAGTPIR